MQRASGWLPLAAFLGNEPPETKIIMGILAQGIFRFSAGKCYGIVRFDGMWQLDEL